MNTKNISPKVRVVYIFVLCWLFGWFIKAEFFFPYLFGTIVRTPVLNNFFPELLAQPFVAQLAYVLPVTAAAVFIRPSLWMLRIAALVMVFSAATLVVHQETCNDATFVTSFWSALWFLWFAVHWEREDEYLFVHSRRIGQWIVGMIFWAGFIGKLTPEYWNGDVFYNIFFVQDSEWLGVWARGVIPFQQAHAFAVVVSCCVIAAEFFLSLAPFLPFALISRYGLLILLGVPVFSTWRIFSVLSCLIGILLACRSWKRI